MKPVVKMFTSHVYVVKLNTIKITFWSGNLIYSCTKPKLSRSVDQFLKHEYFFNILKIKCHQTVTHTIGIVLLNCISVDPETHFHWLH